jgi:preprotein translocase subunit SecE
MIKQITTATSFLKEVQQELGKVVWPTRNQTIRLTGIVIAVSVVVAIYIGLLDAGFTKLFNTIITAK